MPRPRRSLRRLALLAGALLAIGATPVASPANLVTVTAQGTHVLGNPAAKVKLTEYISYSCSHCAHFHEQADARLRLTFVATGKGSVEVVPYIRNPIDMAAALLVGCGGPARFVQLHDIFLGTQAQWLAKVAGLNDAQRARWENGAPGGRMRAIAADLGFYAMVENRGIGQAQADHCLSNEAAMKLLAAQTQAAATVGVEATPGFAIDGVVLTGTYDWAMLEPQLAAR